MGVGFDRIIDLDGFRQSIAQTIKLSLQDASVVQVEGSPVSIREAFNGYRAQRRCALHRLAPVPFKQLTRKPPGEVRNRFGALVGAHWFWLSRAARKDW